MVGREELNSSQWSVVSSQWSEISSQLEWIVGMGPLSTFFVGAGFGAVGECWILVGGRGQAQGLPLQGRLRGKGKTARVGGRGQGRGLPLRERLRGEGGDGAGGGCGQGRGLPVRERLRGKGETVRVGGEGRGRAGTCGDLVGLGGGVGWRRSVGWAPVQYRHQVGEGCCRRGGVAGAEPPHKGGPNRPDRTELQWSVVSGQWS